MAKKQATLQIDPTEVHSAQNPAEDVDQPNQIPVVKQELINQDNEPDTRLNVFPTSQHAVIPNTEMWNHHQNNAMQCVNWNGFYQMQGTAPISPLTMGLQIPIAGVANNHMPVGYPVGPEHLGLQPILAQPTQPPTNKHHQHMNELFNGMSDLNQKQQLFYQKKIGELTEHIKQCDVFSKLQEQNFHKVEQLRHKANEKIDQLQSSNADHINMLHEKNSLINHLTDEIRKKDASMSQSAMKTGFEREKREWIQEKASLVKEKTTSTQEKKDAEKARKQLEVAKNEEIRKLKRMHADEMKVTKDNHKKQIEGMKADFEKQASAPPKKNDKHQKQIKNSLRSRDETNQEIKRWLQFRHTSDQANKHSGSKAKSHQHKRHSGSCHETRANKKSKIDTTADFE